MGTGAVAADAARDQEYVWGNIRLENGFFVNTKVYPLEVIEDQFFSYWVGQAEGRAFLFDPYRKVWYPPPVQYLRTTIQFRGEEIEGFTRVWGHNIQFIDGNYFFGVDGVNYELRQKYRRVGPAGRKHRKLVKSWYVNTLTGEQSDLPPRTVEEQEAYEAHLQALPADAFPRWAEPVTAEEAPPPTAGVDEETEDGDQESTSGDEDEPSSGGGDEDSGQSSGSGEG